MPCCAPLARITRCWKWHAPRATPPSSPHCPPSASATRSAWNTPTEACCACSPPAAITPANDEARLSATWGSGALPFPPMPPAHPTTPAPWCCSQAARIPPPAWPRRSRATREWKRWASTTASATTWNCRHASRCWPNCANASPPGASDSAKTTCSTSPCSGRSATPRSPARPRFKMEASGLPNTFVPGRNLLFLTFAAALAYRRGIQVIVTGVCETDFSRLPRLPRRHHEGAAGRALARHGPPLSHRHPADVDRQGRHLATGPRHRRSLGCGARAASSWWT